MRLPCFALAPVVCAALIAPSGAHAGSISFNVYLDTTDLIGHAAGPFFLDFQLTDGSGTGNGNNTATISNFQFGGGSGAGSATLSGGASGSLATGAALADTSFFNDFAESFTAGTFLAFDVNLTTNVEGGGTPDEFSFAVLDSSGSELPTMGFVDTFVVVDISSGSPTVSSFASDPSRLPLAGGVGIGTLQPIITPIAQPVPERGTPLMLLTAGIVLVACRMLVRA